MPASPVVISAALRRCLPRLLSALPPPAAARALRYHGLSGVVTGAGTGELAPATAAAARTDAIDYAAQFLAWRAEWRSLLAGLGEIPVLVLKGAALAHTLYPEPQWRMLGDLDLLIQPRDRERLDAGLRAAGYRPSLSSGGDLLFSERQYLRQLGPRLSSRVDLHWALSNRPVLAGWAEWPDLWGAAVDLPALNGRGLGVRDALLQACVHRTGHHRREGDRLIWLLDIHLLWHALGHEGRDEAAGAARARGLGALLAAGLDAASDWFGTEFDPELSARLRAAGRREASARLLSARPNAWQDLATLPRWRDRGRYLRQLLFPPRAYMRRRYPQRRRWLYLRRWWDGLRKALPGRRTGN